MKLGVMAAAAMMLLPQSASAIDFQTPVTKHLYTCASPGVSRVALTADPAACCEGQLKCAQFLSTQGLILSRRQPRT